MHGIYALRRKTERDRDRRQQKKRRRGRMKHSRIFLEEGEEEERRLKEIKGEISKRGKA